MDTPPVPQARPRSLSAAPHINRDSMNDRNNTVILGRIIGTDNGWDQGDTFVFNFYDFIPIDGCTIPACESLFVDYESGTIKIYSYENDVEKVEYEIDIVTACQDIPKAPGEPSIQ